MDNFDSGFSESTQGIGTGPIAREKMIAIEFAPPPKRKDFVSYVGRKFERLTVIGHAGKPTTARMWWCECDCGRITKATSSDLLYGRYVSCGCLKRERIKASSTTHGNAGRKKQTPEYRCWTNMIDRCERRDSKNYKNYGARGITVCQRWRESFSAFLSDMGPRPSTQHSIDRVDVDKGYDPSNCRWAMPKTQQNNRRNNKPLTIDGITASRTEWARKSGTSYFTIRSRQKLGWPDKDCVFGRYSG